MKMETVSCVSCEHLSVVNGEPICAHCDRPVTPGNMKVPRTYFPAQGACKMAVSLALATGEELLQVERILHGYV